MMQAVLISSLVLLSALASVAPSVGASCTYNLNVCTGGADCTYNAGYCDGQSSECYVNAGSCVNDGYCTYNVGTCSGYWSTCQVNTGTCQNDGSCTYNAGNCDGGSCEVNLGHCSSDCTINVVACTGTCVSLESLSLCPGTEASLVAARSPVATPAAAEHEGSLRAEGASLLP